MGQNCYLLNCIGYKLDQIFSTAYCKVLFKAMHSIACVTGRQGGKKSLWHDASWLNDCRPNYRYVQFGVSVIRDKSFSLNASAC